MKNINVKLLNFSFPEGFQVITFDEIKSFKDLGSMQFPCECINCPSHNCSKTKCKSCPDVAKCHRKSKFESTKGVDLVAFDNLNKRTLYVIEVKDYRTETSAPIDHIVNYVAKKFRDTLFSIWCGSICENDVNIKSFLFTTKTICHEIQFIFHFESPVAISMETGLYRKKKIVPLLTIQNLLKSKFGPMGNHISVCDIDSLKTQNYPWSVK